MAPGTRRANRSGYVEHDDFEGLPVRQWRHEWVNVAPPVQQEQQQQNDIWAIELIHGMPKDATLLPPHTQELLRAARSGRLYKRPHPSEDDEADGETAIQDKPEKKEEDASAQGYQIRIWKQLPKNVEAPGISHLAKRRKNIVTIASRTVEEKVQGPTVTRATVRRMDAAGNPYTEEVTLSEGQRVEGEVIATRVEAIAAPQQNAFAAPPPSSVRRRPPPPKRKAKAGPGRGKKKIKQPLSTEPQTVGAAPVAGAGAAVTTIKTEAKELLTPTPNESEARNPDSEMGDVDGDDDDEEEEEGDDGDEGEEGDEGEGDETELQDESILDVTKDQDEEMVDASHIIDHPDTEMKDEQPAPSEPAPKEPSPLPPPSIPALEEPLERLTSVPLKQEDTPPRNPVIVPSPSEPSVVAEPTVETIQPMLDALPDNTTDSTIAEPPSTIVGEAPQEAMDRDVPQAEDLPPPDQVGNISSPKTEDENSRISEGTPKGQTSSQPDLNIQKPVLLHTLSTMTEDTIKPEDSVSVTAPLPESEAPSEVGNVSIDDAKEETAPANTVAEPTEPELTAPEVDGDTVMTQQNEPDLLGGLMGELDRQAAASQLLEEAMPTIAPAAEVKPESPAEPTLPEVPEPAPEAAPPITEEAPEPAPESEQQPEPESKPELELEPEPKAEPESEPVADAEPMVESEPVAEPEPVVESEPVAEPKPVTESEPIAEPEPVAEPEPEPEPKAEAEPESESLPVPAPEEQPKEELSPPVKTEPSAAEEGKEEEKEDPPANA
ncbi:hypothetical protein TsFJ059_006962 [Trichoderma semiorbis]|uniref:Apopolysialoglycoprotein n=1 Tax=Trichoderma semiorbis TaxID=1491008 RepID=A0A9P8HE27_9HYPO|nr:hypothetical protein TsFJ059_006962 [Trichoderma semiorbis]